MADATPLTVIEGILEAPVIAFDDAPVLGISPGIGRITLTATVLGRDTNGKPVERHVAVAHLRGTAAAIDALKAALDGIELMASSNGKPEGPMN